MYSVSLCTTLPYVNKTADYFASGRKNNNLELLETEIRNKITKICSACMTFSKFELQNFIILHYDVSERGVLGFPDLWSGQKPWWNWYNYNPCAGFRWSPVGPVSQIHNPHLHVGAPRIISDLIRPFQMLKRKWGAESNGKLPHLFIHSKSAVLVPALAVKDLPLGRTLWWLWQYHTELNNLFYFIALFSEFSPTLLTPHF